MKVSLSSIACRLFSPGEAAAIRMFFTERKIMSQHRKGLKQIKRRSLSRPVKLNLGCGRSPKVGFLNIDRQPPADLTLDLRKGLPFESDCCELIFSEHCFEHFDYPEPVSYLFRECLRVLKPGCALKFSVPDTEWPLKGYPIGPNAPYFKACREYGWHPEDCTTRLEHINYHFRQREEHRFAYDFETAEKALKAAGFTDIQQRAFDPSLDSENRRAFSLFMSALKPSYPNPAGIRPI